MFLYMLEGEIVATLNSHPEQKHGELSPADVCSWGSHYEHPAFDRYIPSKTGQTCVQVKQFSFVLFHNK